MTKHSPCGEDMRRIHASREMSAFGAGVEGEGRGYSLVGTSARIDEVADRFEEEVDLLIELASSELRLRRLAEEIRKTSRRVNAQENILIPRLHSRRAYIEMVLEERAREDLFRLKTVKRAMVKKRAA